MTLNLQEVARAMTAEGEALPVKVTGWSVDTRTQNPGDLYFALRGPNHDGHDFVAAALEKGAVGAVVEKLPENAGRSGGPPYLLVRDTSQALQELGAWARQRWGGQVVGVTGSAGKTTTKDAIAHLLETELQVGKTVGNFNNHVGVPLSILRLPDECRVGVLELGMNHAGEIRELAAIARPEIGVVTNVGYAHVEFFDSIDGVAAAKRELIEGLPPDGVAVLNADDPRVLRFRDAHPGRAVTFGFSECAGVRAEAVDFRAEGTRFRALGIDFETGLTGRHAVLNLLAAIAVAQVFGVSPERLREPVRTFTIGKMRGERLEHNGVVVWNDCYNSNPEAAEAMIDVLAKTPAERRIAVLGEMLELGHAAEELHRELGRYAAEHGVDALIGVRGTARSMVSEAIAAGLPESAAWFFEEPADAGDFVRRWARPGDAVLFKGSRGVRVERALERFLK
ncbi:MAG: UDP-N-acetylmuramoyl-tripeptide--D-alanyl-D-alanine ligase [Acidobacteriia bacterium]|nr:UDP-N-acetylmuramoyl-tripeptide--D-alanyl-D-alanine ligase [Terriglobia bacterium]